MRSTCALFLVACLLLAPVAQAEEVAQTVSTPATAVLSATPVLPSTSRGVLSASPSPSPSPSSTSASQAVSDQIASVALQVAQVANDPSMPVEMKTQQINALAAQFNQLVLVWQQQLPSPGPGVGALTTPSALTPILSATPTPIVAASGSATPTPTTPGSTLSTLPGATTAPLGSMTADQIRAQIAAVSQRMTTVSNDATIPANVKAVQLQDLGNQFNQLLVQLQQAS
jgi:uncharacterized protein (UPF0147 family)